MLKMYILWIFTIIIGIILVSYLNVGILRECGTEKLFKLYVIRT